ncbi:Uncharacterized protein APZ42_021248 [Daphnia magna]|uniref:Uncharacterized protein n=1 Tax=Daphnia magna TaxID=35525 RepID=A0A164WUA4_9CRUS|nr:Uncharacterized protein APZ42_021248 [Daphnia magna]
MLFISASLGEKTKNNSYWCVCHPCLSCLHRELTITGNFNNGCRLATAASHAGYGMRQPVLF